METRYRRKDSNVTRGWILATAILIGVKFCIAAPEENAQTQEGGAKMTTVYDFTATAIDGTPTSLATYKGKVLLIVNVASRCGYTKQYAGLQKLYERYKEQGFEVLGFPSNDFMGQEPGSAEEIQEFCTLKFGVTFPMFDKVVVKGKKKIPLYAHLTAGGGNPELSGAISWNFNKFLIGQEGQILARFGTRTPPLDKTITTVIEGALPKGDEE